MTVMFHYRHGVGIQENKMKLFEVEIKRTSYLTLTIEARDEVAAEKLALDEVKLEYYNFKDANWEVESISTLRKDVR